MSSIMFSPFPAFVSLPSLYHSSLCWYGIYGSDFFSLFSPALSLKRNKSYEEDTQLCGLRTSGLEAMQPQWRRHSRLCLCDCGMNLTSGLIVWAEQRDRRPCAQDSVGGLSVSFALCLCLVSLSRSFHLSLPASFIVIHKFQHQKWLCVSRLWPSPH